MENRREITPAENNLKIKQDDFSNKELRETIKSLNNYKTPGVDFSIIAEAIKHGGPALEVILLKLVNMVKSNLTPPLE